MKKVLQALAEMQVKMPIQTVLLVLLVAFLVSLIIYLTYKNTYTGVLYNPRFNVSLIMITMIPVFPRLQSWTKPAQNFRMLLQML